MVHLLTLCFNTWVPQGLIWNMMDGVERMDERVIMYFFQIGRDEENTCG